MVDIFNLVIMKSERLVVSNICDWFDLRPILAGLRNKSGTCTHGRSVGMLLKRGKFPVQHQNNKGSRRRYDSR